MIIAVDFDGTIVQHKYPHIGAEIPFAIESLLELQKEGHQLILWTYRTGDLLRKPSLGHYYRHKSHPRKIYYFCFLPNLSKRLFK